jgi:hypothetical protein
MPVRRSSRFIKSFTWSGSMFSRLRDQYPPGPHHRSSGVENTAPSTAVAGSLKLGQELHEVHAQIPNHERNQLEKEPKWTFAHDYRRYPASAMSPEHEIPFRSSSTPLAETQPSIRPDIGTAGPQGDPGDEEDDDDESWTKDQYEDFDSGPHHAKSLFEADMPGEETAHDLVDDNRNDDDRVEGTWGDQDWVDNDSLDQDLDRHDWIDDDQVDDDQVRDGCLNSVLVIDQWAEAPFSRASGIAPRPIETPDDAFDTLELHRSRTLQSGLVILALDHHRVPFLHVSLRGNPADDIQRALSLFCPALPNGQIPSGLILGVVRSQHREAPETVRTSLAPFTKPSIWVDPVESAAWRVAAWNLHDEGIRLHDVIVIEPDRWMSLARAAGLAYYDTVQNA